jgi:hypothetical protein
VLQEKQMEKIPMLRQLTAPDLLRAELAAAFGELEKTVNTAVARIALNAKLIAIIADTTEAERAAESVSVATEAEVQEKLEVACDAQVIGIPETANCQLSLQQDSWTGNACARQIYPVEERNAACSWPGPTALSAQNDASDRAENAIAAHVLELHGRLGGFMKR